MNLTAKQSNRIRRIVNEYGAKKVVITPSLDLPTQEVYIDFTVGGIGGGKMEATLDRDGYLITYDRDGNQVKTLSD